MTIPVWILLMFAGWTLLTLIVSVGIYRIGKLITGRARPKEFAFPDVDTGDWHRRAQRAHLNCLENLPVYAAIVIALVALNLRSPLLDRLAIIFFAARVCHTFVHLGFKQRGRVTMVRFILFTVQLICMIGMGVFVATHAG